MKKFVFALVLIILTGGCSEEHKYVPKLSFYNIEMCKVTLCNSQTQENNFYILKNISGNISISESSVQLFLDSDVPANKDLLLFNGSKFDLNKNDTIFTSIIFYGKYYLVTQRFEMLDISYYIYVDI